VLVSGALRRRLGELERAVEGIKEAGVAGEERRTYCQRSYSAEQTDARGRERRQGDRELLERNRASVGGRSASWADDIREERLASSSPR
jgi:hypothetical protein